MLGRDLPTPVYIVAIIIFKKSYYWTTSIRLAIFYAVELLDYRLSDHCFRKTTELSATGLRNSTIGRPIPGTRKPGKNYRCPALVSSLPLVSDASQIILRQEVLHIFRASISHEFAELYYVPVCL